MSGFVTFVRSDLFSAFAGGNRGAPFDVIVSNPPYVSEAEWEEMEPGIKDHEPREALVPGATGLEAIRRIIRESPAYLEDGGWLILEMGAGQAENVLREFSGGWRDVSIHRDLQGLPRAVCAERKAPCEFNL